MFLFKIHEKIHQTTLIRKVTKSFTAHNLLQQYVVSSVFKFSVMGLSTYRSTLEGRFVTVGVVLVFSCRSCISMRAYTLKMWICLDSRIQIFHLCNNCSFQYKICIFVANSVCRAIFKGNYDEADQENFKNLSSNK